MTKPTIMRIETQDNNTITEYSCTIDQAVALVKKQGGKRRYFIQGGTFLRAPANEGDEPGTVRGWDVNCTISVGKRQAVKYVQDIFRKAYEEKGGRMRISVHAPTETSHFKLTYLFIG